MIEQGQEAVNEVAKDKDALRPSIDDLASAITVLLGLVGELYNRLNDIERQLEPEEEATSDVIDVEAGEVQEDA